MTYIVFGKENCNYCTLAESLLDTKGLKYHYKDVNDKRNRELLMHLAEMVCVEVNTVPQIFVAEDYKYSHLGGYKELSEALK